MKKINNIIILLLFPFIYLLAQPINKYVDDVVMPGPEAAAMMKYGDIPISHYTGQASINIPIHTFSRESISHHVSLSYHGSGMRVEEMSSRVGTGWALQAGGMVSRVVNGIADESILKKGYIHNSNDLENLNANELEGLWSGARDGEPDLFNFNAGSYSGKFFIDKNQKVQLVPHQDVKVEYLMNASKSDFIQFKIIAPDGSKYFFGKFGNQTAYDFTAPSLSTTPYKTTWHLIRIESYNGLHHISFEYEEDNYSYLSLAGCKKILSSSFGPGNGCENLVTSCSSNSSINIQNTNFRYQHTHVNGKRLRRIYNGLDEVTFTSLAERQDLRNVGLSNVNTNKKMLNRIKVKKGAGAEALCHELRLIQNYETSAYGSHLPEGKRLFLNRIKTFSCSQAQLKPDYIFSYNKDYPVPFKLTRARDHWGFFNGKFNNDHEAVNVPYTELVGDNNQVVSFGGALRETDERFLKVGSLERIWYPTGGDSRIIYEANQIAVNATVDEELLNFSNCGATPSPSTCCGTPDIANQNLQLNSQNTSNLAVDLWLSSISGMCQNSNIKIHLKVKHNAQVLASEGYFYSTSIESKRVPLSPQFVQNIKNYLNNNTGTNIQLTFELSVTNGKGKVFVVNRSNTVENQDVGGLRINKMITHDKMRNASNIIKTFSYNDENGLSTGKLLFKPTYGVFTSGYGIPESGGQQTTINAFLFNSSGISPSNSYESNHIGYETVKESLNGSGHITHEFEVQEPATNLVYPAPPSNLNVENGTLKKKQNLNQQNQIISEVEQLRYNAIPPKVTAGNIWRTSEGISCNGNAVFFVIPYHIMSDQYLVGTSKSKIDGVETTTLYEYNNAKKYLSPKAQVMTNSNGDIYRQEYVYPHDLENPNISEPDNINEKLVQKNLIVPIQTISKVNAQVVDGNYTQYQETTLNNGIIPLPKKHFRREVTWTKAGNRVETNTPLWKIQATIDTYDKPTGKPKVVTIDGWLPQIYTWNPFALMTSKRFTVNNISHTLSYIYRTNSDILKTSINVDGTATSFDYDDLFRLKEIKDDCRNTSSTFSYHFGNAKLGQNYIEVINSIPPKPHSAVTELISKTIYDGLGREIQQIKRNQGPTSNQDLITATYYDKFGRVSRSYVSKAFANNNGAYQDPLTLTNWKYGTKTYYADPTNRKRQDFMPGWTFPKNYSFQKNAAVLAGYPIGSLNKSTIVDEAGHRNVTYTDKRGRTIVSAQETKQGINPLTTINIYDYKDRIIQVIPPGSNINKDNLNFSYTYYGNDLIQTKKLPDQDEIEYRYNQRDKISAFQDGYLRSQNKWVAYNYDGFGRTTREGFATNALPNNNPAQVNIPSATILKQMHYGSSPTNKDKMTREQKRVLLSNGNLGQLITKDYTYNTCGLVNRTKGNNHLNGVLTAKDIIYEYDLLDNLLSTTSNIKNSAGAITNLRSISTKDFAGRSKQELCSLNGAPFQTVANKSYDEKNLLRKLELGKHNPTGNYLQEINYDYLDNGYLSEINPNGLNGNDLFYLKLNYYSGLTGISNAQVSKNGNIAEIITQVKGNERHLEGFIYDQYNRLFKSFTRDVNDNNANPTNINNFNTVYNYDSRGNITRLIRRGLYHQNGIQKAGTIDNLFFTMVDNSNQLKHVDDVINGLHKNQGVTDAETEEYTYDNSNGNHGNGNVIYDPVRKASISYNHLNLPRHISLPNHRSIEYNYDASGTLLYKITKQNSTILDRRDYIENIEYKNNLPIQINHPYGRITYNKSCKQNQYVKGLVKDASQTFEGATLLSNIQMGNNSNIELLGANRVVLHEGFTTGMNNDFIAKNMTCGQSAWQYQYDLKDHLGNTRVSFTDTNNDGEINADTEILSEQHYYPFGMAKDGKWNTRKRNDQQYQYTGKEHTEDFGIDLMNFGARFYDAGLGRWLTEDALSEKYLGSSPYNYVANNPINSIDPDGNLIIFVNGLRVGKGNADQQKWLGGGGVHKSDIYDYWRTDSNTFGRKVDLVDQYQNKYQDENSVFTSGSSHWTSQASQRQREGRTKAETFHKMVQNGEITLADNETIKLISHSHGGAHAAGFAEKLLSYKDANGNAIYKVEVIEYITPHQPGDINHPEGVDGIQYSHPGDSVSSKAPWWLPNGGSKYNVIESVRKFLGGDIMGGNNQPPCEGPNGNRCGHTVTDNDEFIKNN